jgi:hypothetical protein
MPNEFMPWPRPGQRQPEDDFARDAQILVREGIEQGRLPDCMHDDLVRLASRFAATVIEQDRSSRNSHGDPCE